MATEEEVAIIETIAEAEASARQGLKEGDPIYNINLAEGADMKRTKESSMVRSNGVPLPERLPFYHSRTGALVRLPTVQLAYHLGKRFPDGSAVFVKERPGPEPEYIEQECKHCIKTAGRTKRFYEFFDYVSHMENKHPRELRIEEMQRKQDGGDFMQAVLGMDQQQRAALKALLGGDNGNTGGTAAASEGTGDQERRAQEQGRTRVPCPECGKPVKPAGLKLHRARYCPEGSGSGSGADASAQAV